MITHRHHAAPRQRLGAKAVVSDEVIESVSDRDQIRSALIAEIAKKAAELGVDLEDDLRIVWEARVEAAGFVRPAGLSDEDVEAWLRAVKPNAGRNDVITINLPDLDDEAGRA